MALNIVKVCVGVSSIEELEGWIAHRAGLHPDGHVQTTKMIPKRIDELKDGGSLYWVIKGFVQCRQRFIDVNVYTDGENIRRCGFILDPTIIPTQWQPRRAFQGWRYLDSADAPADQDGGDSMGLPANLHSQLADLGLL